MTHPNDYPPSGRTVGWPGVAAGLFGVPFVIFVVDRLMERGEFYVLSPFGALVLGLIVFRWRDPFWRGVLVGMLLAVAITMIVLAGLCFKLASEYS